MRVAKLAEPGHTPYPAPPPPQVVVFRDLFLVVDFVRSAPPGHMSPQPLPLGFVDMSACLPLLPRESRRIMGTTGSEGGGVEVLNIMRCLRGGN